MDINLKNIQHKVPIITGAKKKLGEYTDFNHDVYTRFTHIANHQFDELLAAGDFDKYIGGKFFSLKEGAKDVISSYEPKPLTQEQSERNVEIVKLLVRYSVSEFLEKEAFMRGEPELEIDKEEK